MKIVTALLQTIVLATATVSGQGPPTVKAVLQSLGIGLDPTSLRHALSHPRDNVRSLAATELAEQKDMGAIPEIQVALNYERSSTGRLNMAASLLQLGDEHGRPVLKEICQSDSEEFSLRMMAADDLENFRSDYSCAPSLLGFLQLPEAALRESVLLYLVHVPHTDKDSTPFGPVLLDVALNDSFPYNRELAAKALDHLGDAASQATYRTKIGHTATP